MAYIIPPCSWLSVESFYAVQLFQLFIPQTSLRCASINKAFTLFKMSELKVNLAIPFGAKAPGSHRTIRVSRLCCGELRTLDISLQRTIRVPDNTKAYQLPPSIGSFPIYNVRDFTSKLPPPLVEKGSLFIPIYRTWKSSIARVLFSQLM